MIGRIRPIRPIIVVRPRPLVRRPYCTSLNLPWGVPQTGHTSGAPPVTVLPHTGHTKIRPCGRSLPACTAASAVVYRPWWIFSTASALRKLSTAPEFFSQLLDAQLVGVGLVARWRAEACVTGVPPDGLELPLIKININPPGQSVGHNQRG